MSETVISQDPTHNHEEGDDLENGANESRGVKRPRTSTAADDDDDDDDKPGRERRKIEIKFIQDKSRRHITFSKRKAGIMKKVRLRPCDIQRDAPVSRLQASADFHFRPTSCPSSPAPRCFFSSCRRPVSSTPSRRLSCSPWSPSPKARTSSRSAHLHLTVKTLPTNIPKACLNAPEPADSNGVDGDSAVESPEEQHAAPPPMPQAMPQQGMRNSAPQQQYMTADQQQALQYQAYLQQQQAAQQGAYPIPPQQGMHQQR